MKAKKTAVFLLSMLLSIFGCFSVLAYDTFDPEEGNDALVEQTVVSDAEISVPGDIPPGNYSAGEISVEDTDENGDLIADDGFAPEDAFISEDASIPEDGSVSEDWSISEDESISEDGYLAEDAFVEEEEFAEDGESLPEEDFTLTEDPKFESSGTYSGLTWTLSNDGVFTISGNGPLPYGAYPWNYTSYYSAIRSIVIEEGVTSIGKYAFGPGTSPGPRYESLYIPASVREIGNDAFRMNSSLTKLTFAPRTASDTLTIGEYAFYQDNGLKELVLPEGLTEIGDYAFNGCTALQLIVFPRTYTGGGFSIWNSNLKNVYGFEGTPVEDYWKSSSSVTFISRDMNSSRYTLSLSRNAYPEDGSEHKPGVTVMYNNKVTGLKEGTDFTLAYADNVLAGMATVIASGMGFFEGDISAQFRILTSEWLCGADVTWQLLPDGTLMIVGTGATDDYADASEAPWASEADAITAVVVSNGITRIGSYAFASLPNLSSVTLPDSLVQIGDKALFDTPALEAVTVPDHIGSIGTQAIGYQVDGSVKDGFELTGSGSSKAGEYAAAAGIYLEDTDLLKGGTCGTNVSWKLDRNQTRLTIIKSGSGTDAMTYYSQAVNVPWHEYKDTITQIAFEGTLSKINCFAFCDLASVKELVIPDSVTEIASSALSNMYGLEKLTLPAHLKMLQSDSIEFCTKLTSLNIPAECTSIQARAISNCINLSSVFIPATVSSIADNAVSGLTKLRIYGEIGSPAETFAAAPGGSGSSLKFDFVDVDLAHALVTVSTSDIPYDGTARKPSVTVVQSGTTLKEGQDYTLSWSNNINPGTAKVTVTGKSPLYGSKEAFFTIISHVTVTTEVDTYVYDGKAKKPPVTVRDDVGVIPASRYTVSYSNNKNAGKAVVTVTMKAPYSGIATTTFTIKPPKTTLNKLTAQKKKIKVTWKKQKTQTSGYKIMYSLKKDFSENKIVTVAGAKKTSYTLKGLKSKKKYYIRICTYKKIGNVVVNSSWSAKKSVKTK